jgi:hypothetical protein
MDQEELKLQKCSCGCTIFQQVSPIELEDGALTMYRHGSPLLSKTATVPVLRCLVCSRLVATRTSFAGRNRLDPEVKMYARLMKVISDHNELIDIAEASNASYQNMKSCVTDIEPGFVSEDAFDCYTKTEIDAMIAGVLKNVKSTGTNSGKAIKKNS